MRPLLLLLFVAGCGGRTMRFPGPLGAVTGDGEGWTAPAERPRVRPTAPEPAPAEAPVAAPPEETTPARQVVASRRSDPVAERAAKAAEYYLSHKLKSGFRDDCSGLVCASYARAGFDMRGGVRDLWAAAREANATHRRRPRVGDLIFFDQTYDANRNGRWDDKLTHVAVVLKVLDDGTVEFAHGGTGRGRVRGWMNLDHPHTWKAEDGRALNSHMRRKRKGDPRSARYLAGELFVGFATVREEDDDLW